MSEVFTIGYRKVPIRVISVDYEPTEYPLGTEDGHSYMVYPSLPDNDEDGQHGRKV